MVEAKSHKVIYYKQVDYRRRKYEGIYTQYFKNVLTKQFKDLADSITTDNYNNPDVVNKITPEPVEKMLLRCWQMVGADFAMSTYKQHAKAFDPDKESEWYGRMRDYFTTRAGKRIASINDASRKQALKIIRSVLEEGLNEGWGSDKTASEIRKSIRQVAPEINQWRALRIARTEVVGASNRGSLEGMRSLNMPFEKIWIAVPDARTRDTHREVEQQNPKNQDETFRVGEYEMDGPGDMSAGPEEIINCRCTIAYNLKPL